MNIAYIVINDNDDSKLLQTVNTTGQLVLGNNLYILSTNSADWELIGNICKPCCGNKDSYREETNEKYSLKAVKNVTGIKFENKEYLYNYIGNELNTKYEIIFIIYSGYIISYKNTNVLLSVFSDANIGAVYADSSEIIPQSVSPLSFPKEDRIAGLAIKSSILDSTIHSLTDMLALAYKKSIIYHIPEMLYEQIY